MIIISLVLSIGFVASILDGIYSSAPSVIAAVIIVIATMIFITIVPTPLRKRMVNIEKRFISNINERENRRTGRDNNLVSDLHLAYMTVGRDCPFVGEKLRNLDLRTRYGVNLASVQRAGKVYPVPSGDMRIFPRDVIGVIATEDQIERLLPLVEAQNEAIDAESKEVKFVHFSIGSQSPIVGKKLEETHLREDYGALLVAVQRGDEYVYPTRDLAFKADDILWIVGDPQKLTRLKG